MRKDKSYFDKKAAEATAKKLAVMPPAPLVCRTPPPPLNSWTARNMGPGGYIDRFGVPCKADWM
jgi:hypothetical protein